MFAFCDKEKIISLKYLLKNLTTGMHSKYLNPQPNIFKLFVD